MEKQHCMQSVFAEKERFRCFSLLSADSHIGLSFQFHYKAGIMGTARSATQEYGRNGGDWLHRKVFVLLGLVLFVGVIGVAGWPERVRAATVAFTLYGSAGGIFQPSQGWGFASDSITTPGPAISVDQYDNVSLTLVSQDGLPHQFFVDYNNNSLIDVNEPSSQVFTSSTFFSFNASRSGTFTYRCSVHPSMMYGTFTAAVFVPEFSLLMMLPFFGIATLVAVMVRRAKHEA
jgi:hypothetical protein